MGPEHVYYVGLIVAAALAMTGSRMALLLTAAGAVACLAYQLGVPMAVAYLWIHILGFVIGTMIARGAWCKVIVGLFVLLGFADVLEILGHMSAADAWWNRYWLVLAQLAILFPSELYYLLSVSLLARGKDVPAGHWFRVRAMVAASER